MNNIKKTFLFFPKIKISIVFILLIFITCSNKKREKETSFYWWKSKGEISKKEYEYLNELEVGKLYVRFFDIKWNYVKKEAYPVAVLKNNPDTKKQFEIIPTVYITNKTLLQISDNEIGNLAKNILKKISSIKPLSKIKELQFDCDWSDKTRGKYFKFLKEIKKQIVENKINISSTIRLHQIKYFEKTGVPPVDRGMLMFYNMGKVQSNKTKNSILDLKTAKKYFHNFDKYPLKLDIALPLFSWGVLFRNKRAVGLINNVRKKDFLNNSNFKKIENNKFKVLKNHYFSEKHCYKNDEIRLEEISEETLKEAAKLLSEQITTQKLNVVFYHLDKKIIKNYQNETLKSIIDNF